jgi:hypothetical protein
MIPYEFDTSIYINKEGITYHVILKMSDITIYSGRRKATSLGTLSKDIDDTEEELKSVYRAS